MANVNTGRNTFNAVSDIDGPTPGVEAMLIDDKQRYEITFVQDGDLLAARTSNHPDGSIGTINFTGADQGYEYDFELSSVIIDTDPASASKVVKFTFYDYKYNGGAGKKRAGPLFDLVFTLDGISASTDREPVNNSANEVISYYTYPYGGQALDLITMAQEAVDAGAVVSLMLSTSAGDTTNGYSVKKV